MSDKKSSILPAAITRFRDRRHIETQTNHANHASFWGLHYQSENIRRSKTTVCVT